MKKYDKFIEVKDFQQFRAKAGAGAGVGAGAVVFKVDAWSRSRSKMERLRNTGYDKCFPKVIISVF